MADVRALLKAKRQEARITHPFAAYTSAGQLRCSACSTPVKHASAWEGHIGSKGHRTNVARLREEERRQQEQAEREEAEAHAAAEAAKRVLEETTSGKRKAIEDDEDEDEDEDMETDTNEKDNAKRRRVGPAPSSFPADFFSDPSRAPIPSQPDSDDENEEEKSASVPAPHKAPPTAIDLEYERFQREMLGSDATQTDKHETYDRATVVAEPELVEIEEAPAGFAQGQDQQMDVDTDKQNEEELARQRQKEQDERELIMDRLLDEERAQEEADQRVSAIKARLEALKQRRSAKKTKA